MIWGGQTLGTLWNPWESMGIYWELMDIYRNIWGAIGLWVGPDLNRCDLELPPPLGKSHKMHHRAAQIQLFEQLHSPLPPANFPTPGACSTLGAPFEQLWGKYHYGRLWDGRSSGA